MKNLNVDRRLIVIMLIVFVQSTGATMLTPILPLYAQDAFSLSPRLITILGATFFAGQSIAAPFLGRWSDKHGRIPLLLISQVGTVLCYVGMALANASWMLFVARAVDGLTGGNYVVAHAYLADISSAENRTKMFGYLASAGSVGFIIGPAIGGTLGYLLGFRATYFVASGVAAIVVLLTWFILDETVSPTKQTEVKEEEDKKGYRLLLSNQILLWLLVIIVAYNFGSTMFQSTFALFGESEIFVDQFAEIASIGIGALVTVIGVVMVFTQTVLLGRLLEKITHTRLLMLGALFTASGMLILAGYQSIPVTIGACIIYGFGFAVTHPTMQALITLVAPEESSGALLGLCSSIATITIVSTMVISGTLFALSATLPYWVGGLILLVALIPGGVLHRQYSAKD